LKNVKYVLMIYYRKNYHKKVLYLMIKFVKINQNKQINLK